ncbi:hypothetical protein BASA50_009064 [Batrachochytrium salamandrivorans]|uniref:FCP1 homology domain-containing protein n=1 Tax=Batrachochytrium salamandrivorans TaxID=1357716 RepID=A0ABQ8F2Q9_9FUNG|nr:hypothetical protein BASA62_009597 [Batrachochytrium salamandrivorans]KAH6570477.1 hypothetical protein BASA60_007685 [Batrachochytrium salamandrivorans]KAH6578500.1 hypothetical protein BASA61_000258 [Batrachochytrium salamandrivorans]KAH6591064.1 hypothetical protein BASA50_009064 [Batrachochytrium salamandrivorans]KAH9268783.1 hypothetical protein BASA84_000014 [Batrachochytrium salamandrivorans]
MDKDKDQAVASKESAASAVATPEPNTPTEDARASMHTHTPPRHERTLIIQLLITLSNILRILIPILPPTRQWYWQSSKVPLVDSDAGASGEEASSIDEEMPSQIDPRSPYSRNATPSRRLSSGNPSALTLPSSTPSSTTASLSKPKRSARHSKPQSTGQIINASRSIPELGVRQDPPNPHAEVGLQHRRKNPADSLSTSTLSPSSLPPGMSSRRQRLDRKQKKTLVLDLDETLIHSTSRGSRRHDFIVEVLVDKHACLYYVYKRPHVDLFLRKAAEWFKIVIFTASMPEYADPVIDWLDSTRTIVAKRYFRQSCTCVSGTFTKNLGIVESDLSQVCLVDNAPLSYSLNPDNGIPIDTWIDDPNDEALLDLLPFLDALRFADDVRSVLSLRM